MRAFRHWWVCTCTSLTLAWLEPPLGQIKYIKYYSSNKELPYGRPMNYTGKYVNLLWCQMRACVVSVRYKLVPVQSENLGQSSESSLEVGAASLQTYLCRFLMSNCLTQTLTDNSKCPQIPNAISWIWHFFFLTFLYKEMTLISHTCPKGVGGILQPTDTTTGRAAKTFDKLTRNLIRREMVTPRYPP